MGVDDGRLSTELWGETLSNPIGLAAGFDKNGEAIDGLFNLGFGWVEIGSVTPKPQPGNPTPRVFHLPDDSAMINRYGFPSEGATSVLSRLRARLPKIFADRPAPEPEAHASLRPHALLAINLGKNKASAPDAITDFLNGIKTFGPYADVLVVNVSSPNTPGLRGLQTRGLLEELLAGITAEREALPLSAQTLTARRPRIVLKIAPDLSEIELKDVAEAVKASSGVDGVIVSNTTVQRPLGLTDSRKTETGGLSGSPLKPLTLRALRTLRAHLPESVPLIGCGGISTGADALDYARAGASAVQLYTGFGYDGVGACRRIKDELADALALEGTTWRAVVQKAVGELAARQPIEVPKSSAESGLQTLIEEALSIKEQLETFGKKMAQDSSVLEETSGTL
ncbi:Dihydroorotate dehydrogenase, partial [Phellopilus nigrolimitatus]